MSTSESKSSYVTLMIKLPRLYVHPNCIYKPQTFEIVKVVLRHATYFQRNTPQMIFIL